jgi:hypothetical protein
MKPPAPEYPPFPAKTAAMIATPKTPPRAFSAWFVPAATPTSSPGTAAVTHAIQVVTVEGGLVTRIVSFDDGRLLRRFGFPAELTGDPDRDADSAGGAGTASGPGFADGAGGPTARRP